MLVILENSRDFLMFQVDLPYLMVKLLSKNLSEFLNHDLKPVMQRSWSYIKDLREN